MRTRDALARLAAAGQPVLSAADSLVDPAEQEWIFERILASDRFAARAARPRRTALVLAAVALLAAAAAATALELGGGRQAVTGPSTHRHVPLTGAQIELAGYRFRTPAGFTASSSPCLSAPAAGKPRPALDGFAAAAAADGACVEGAYVVAGDWLQTHDPIPDSAQPVDVGSYQGYYVPAQTSGGKTTLYVRLPHADGNRVVYLALLARGVSEDELIAIAVSGLPTLPPPGPTPTTGTEPTG